MKETQILDDWQHLLQFLPDNMDELAKSCGAVARWRNISNGEELLRLNLAYVIENFSLRTTAGWSSQSKLAQMEDTSVLHRLRSSVPFLEHILAYLINHRIFGEPAVGLPFRIKDATVLSVPGSTGTDWRLHATYDPHSARLVRMELTDSTGGERLDRDHYHTDEIVIADRGLAHSKGLHAVDEEHAFSLVRAHMMNIRLLDTQGKPLDIPSVLLRADMNDIETQVLIPLEGKPSLRARLLVRPLPAEKQKEALRRLRKNAHKKGSTPRPLSLMLAGYCCLLTTIPEELASADVIFEIYRIRWQIELFFKRCKSLLSLDHLRAFDPNLVQVHILGKLIEVAFIALLTTEGESFSPWGLPRRRHPAPVTMAVGAFTTC
jgi:hypothetical protein